MSPYTYTTMEPMFLYCHVLLIFKTCINTLCIWHILFLKTQSPVQTNSHIHYCRYFFKEIKYFRKDRDILIKISFIRFIYRNKQVLSILISWFQNKQFWLIFDLFMGINGHLRRSNKDSYIYVEGKMYKLTVYMR